MKQLGRTLAVAIVICALPLLAGCSSQQDSTAQQTEPTAQSQPGTASATDANANANTEDSGAESVGGDIWEVITFPFRVVGDIVGFIL